MNLRTILSQFLGIQRAGIDLWIDPPGTYELRLDPEDEPRDGGFVRPLGSHGPVPNRSAPPRNLRHLKFHRRLAGTDRWDPCALAIDVNKRRIEWAYSSMHLLGHEHRGSAAIGVFLFSLPTTLPLSPWLYLVKRRYERQEVRERMSRHASAVLEALSGQLDAATEALLRETFRNEWRFERLMARIPTFEEARAILEVLTVEEHVLKDALGGGEFRSLIWRDREGNVLARCVRPDCLMVLSATFDEPGEIAALTCCYALKTTIVDPGETP